MPSWIQLHAALTHFPIALFWLAAALEIVGLFQNEAARQNGRSMSLVLLGVGFAAALPSLLTGYLHRRQFAQMPPQFRGHWLAAASSTVLSGTVFGFRVVRRDQFGPKGRLVALVLTVLAALSVGWAGHLGGLMVLGS